MLDFIVYENDDKRKILGKCIECGCNVYNTEDHYLVHGDLICEECRDAYMDNFIEYGVEDELY